MKKVPAIVILLSGMGVGTALAVAYALSLNYPGHDDALTYLNIAGHLERFYTDPPAGRWTTAGEWQSFWRLGPAWEFGTIRRHLVRFSLHPPLYFWLMHLWSHWLGIDVLTGPLLNLLLYPLVAVLIVVVCRQVQCRPEVSAVVAVLWLLSAATLSVAIAARCYFLLALCVTAFCAALLLYLEKRAAAALPLITLCAAAGLLTQYTFGILLGYSALVAGAILARRRAWRDLLAFSLALVAASATLVLIHPGFHKAVAIARSQAQAEPSGWQEVAFRLDRILSTVLHLYVPVRIAKLVAAGAMRFWGLAAALILAAGAGALLLRRRLRSRSPSPGAPDYACLPLAVSSATLLTYAVVYLAQLLPRPHLLDRHLLLVSPLLFVVAGQVLDRLISRRSAWQWMILALLLAYGLVFGGVSILGHVRDLNAEPVPPFPDAETPVILDSVQAGVLPPILWYADPATPVYAASQNDLLDHFPDVPSSSSKVLYISSVRMGNTEEGQRSILERLKVAGFGQVEEKDSVFWQTTVYELRRPGH